jgi:hypothetical protein
MAILKLHQALCSRGTAAPRRALAATVQALAATVEKDRCMDSSASLAGTMRSKR